MDSNKKITDEVSLYYSEKIKEHGATAKGVDWNSETTQHTRFDELLKILGSKANFSVLDYGCGYGALLDSLQKNFTDFTYAGFDISPEMLNSARAIHPPDKQVKWFDKPDNSLYDYSVASGIFNVKMKQTKKAWRQYIETTLSHMDSISSQGFSFNMLTKYSDKPLMRDYLYYADPCYYFDLCKTKFSKNVALLHDYGLYEFTILVKKEIHK